MPAPAAGHPARVGLGTLDGAVTNEEPMEMHPPSPPGRSTGLAAETRLIVLASLALVVTLAAIPMTLVVNGSGAAMRPHASTLGLLVLTAAVALGVAESVGHWVRPLDPADPPGVRAAAVRAAWFERLAVRVLPAVAVTGVAIACAVVADDGGAVLLVLGLGVTCLLLAYEGLPSRRAVERVAAGLEADGARSGLREEFGLPPVAG